MRGDGSVNRYNFSGYEQRQLPATGMISFIKTDAYFGELVK
jgi:hypothetical protein